MRWKQGGGQDIPVEVIASAVARRLAQRGMASAVAQHLAGANLASSSARPLYRGDRSSALPVNALASAVAARLSQRGLASTVANRLAGGGLASAVVQRLEKRGLASAVAKRLSDRSKADDVPVEAIASAIARQLSVDANESEADLHTHVESAGNTTMTQPSRSDEDSKDKGSPQGAKSSGKVGTTPGSLG